MNRLLDSIYYNTNSPACFAGINAVWREAKQHDSTIKRQDVIDYLHEQNTYTLHKPIKRKFKRNKVKSYGLDTHWQADLCDMQLISKYNGGFKHLLTVIDVLSKFGWAIPIKNKKPETVRDAFKKILQTGRKCWFLFTDRGTEFRGKHFQDFLHKKYIVHYISTDSSVKAQNVERYNRTLKTRLWKYFTQKKTKHYLDILPNIVKAINHSYSSVIGCRPVDVTVKNEALIRKRLYGEINLKRKKRQFKVGDKVRITKEKGTFTKGYLPNFTKEVFTISQRLSRDPPVYRIKDSSGEEIEGVFYLPELVRYVEEPKRVIRYK